MRAGAMATDWPRWRLVVAGLATWAEVSTWNDTDIAAANDVLDVWQEDR